MSNNQSTAAQAAGGVSGLRGFFSRLVAPAAAPQPYAAAPIPTREDNRCFAVHPSALDLGLVPSLRCVLERHATGAHASSTDPHVRATWTGNFASGTCSGCQMTRNDLHLGCASCVDGRLDRIGFCTDCCEAAGQARSQAV
jgi:hypothetical protein